MKLSIIIPVFNGEKCIEKCLNSILKATNSDEFELIIINDGSKDNTKMILSDFSRKDKRVKVFNNENHGVSYTRNYGVEKACGQYIMFVDADDYLDAEWFDIVSNNLNGENDVVYYYGDCDVDLSTKEKLIEEIMCLRKKSGVLAGPYSKIYKKEKMKDVRFDENLINGEDMLFNLEIALKLDSYQIVNKSFYNYIIYQGSATQSFKPKIILSDKMFHEKLNKLLEDDALEDKLVNGIKMHCVKNAVLVLNNRISFIDNFEEAKEKYDVFKDSPYKQFLDKVSMFRIKTKQDFIIWLTKIKMYYLVYCILKCSNKRRFKKSKQDYCVKI